jgi:hypothetical protein
VKTAKNLFKWCFVQHMEQEVVKSAIPPILLIVTKPMACIVVQTPIHSDTDIPNGPAEEGTRGLLKAHDPMITKPGSPIRWRYGR